MPGKSGVSVLEVERVSKSFESTRAVDDVSFTVGSGEVVALLGHNGSGKSTLIKLITGYHRPEAGRITFSGREVKKGDRPVAVMHQDLGLVHSLSVLDNLRIGRYETGLAGRIRWGSERSQATQKLREFECTFDPGDAVSELAQGDRAMVALLRALEGLRDERRAPGRGVLLLDEPTASLASKEVEQVLNAVWEVKARGYGVVMVTHHLREAVVAADRVLVMRNGKLVLEGRVGEVAEDEIIGAMVVGGGHERTSASFVVGEELQPSTVSTEPVLEVEHLSGGTVADVSFQVRPGEVVGLAGLAGSGNTEIPYLLSGGRRRAGGVVFVDGCALPAGKPSSAKERGVVLIPSDRQRQSGVMSMSVAWNISMPRMKELRKWGSVDSGIERTLVERVMRSFRVQPDAPKLPLGSLSGGNQQRALVGRWLDSNPKVLLLDDPCSGVDVVSRQEILGELRRAATGGMAVVMSSSQDDELAEACTRVLIISRGSVVKELTGDEISAERVGRECLTSSLR